MARIHKSDLDDNLAEFIKEKIPKAEIRTVFDIGANVGWVTISFLNAFRDAKVWSFEPVPAVHEALRENVTTLTDIERVELFDLALGSENKPAPMTNLPGRGVTVNRIIDVATPDSIDVDVVRGDSFCLSKEIEHIDYLKINVEGYDMKALLGFGSMLSSGAIDFVQVKAGISPDDTIHVNIKFFEGVLLPLGYHILAIKNQASLDVPYLLWADVIFIRAGAAVQYA